MFDSRGSCVTKWRVGKKNAGATLTARLINPIFNIWCGISFSNNGTGIPAALRVRAGSAQAASCGLPVGSQATVLRTLGDGGGICMVRQVSARKQSGSAVFRRCGAFPSVRANVIGAHRGGRGALRGAVRMSWRPKPFIRAREIR